jgi:hypothetical protein
MKLEKGIIYLTIVGIIVSQVSVLSYVNAVDNISIQNKDNREIKSALQGIDGLLSESSEVNLKSDNDSAGIVKTNNSTIDIPKNPDEPVNIKAGTTSINISLPELEGAKEGKVIAKGVVAYASESDFSNTVQANNDGSVRMTTIIDNSDAPTEYEYKIGVKGEFVLKEAVNEDGGKGVIVFNKDQSKIISIISPPWAKDANGKDVKTYFKIRNNKLIQVVEHKVSGIAYPVVADPVIGRHWWGYSYYFNRSETNNIMFATGAGTAIFFRLPFVSVPLGVFTAWANWAYNRGACLATHQVYSGPSWFWSYTGGNCR